MGMYADGWKAVTLHGQRRPWEIAATFPFEDDVWELYDTVNDPSESHNVAAEFPEKLRDLQRLWIEESMKYNVFPLNDKLAERLKQAYVHFAPRGDSFTYWTPGAVRINEPLSAAQLGKTHNHSITAYIKEMTPETEGIVVAVGGMTGGYALYIKDGMAAWTYNFLGMNRTTIKTPDPLPVAEGGAEGRGQGGALELKLDVVLVPSDDSLTGVSANVSLSVNGEVVASKTVPQWTQGAFSMEEAFDVGVDFGTSVDSTIYSSPFPFTPTEALDRVVYNLTLGDSLRASDQKVPTPW